MVQIYWDSLPLDQLDLITTGSMYGTSGDSWKALMCLPCIPLGVHLERIRGQGLGGGWAGLSIDKGAALIHMCRVGE